MKICISIPFVSISFVFVCAIGQVGSLDSKETEEVEDQVYSLVAPFLVLRRGAFDVDSKEIKELSKGLCCDSISESEMNAGCVTWVDLIRKEEKGDDSKYVVIHYSASTAIFVSNVEVIPELLIALGRKMRNSGGYRELEDGVYTNMKVQNKSFRETDPGQTP